MEKTCESKKRFGKEKWLTAHRKPRTLEPMALRSDLPTKEKTMNKTNEAKKESRAKEGEFKGKPVLGLYRDEGDKYPFQFGVAKAGLILAHVEEIKAFEAKHQKQAAPAAA